MKKRMSVLLALISSLTAAHARPYDPRPERPVIQLALLLDTSNSMDGLIAQAKSQLWRVVNDLAGSHCRGHAPRIEVALYEYGNNGLSAGEKYIRQVLPFTSDLDLVSEKLFSLSTNGGDEYCGAVINDAVRNLAWDRRGSTYKTIFIAGNEPFTQGEVNFRDAVQRAVDKGVIVNTIFCGDRREGIQTAWLDGAERGRGAYLSINQDQRIAVRATPYDDEISRLGRDMNDTYVFYGHSAPAAVRRMAAADQGAGSAGGGAMLERSLFKSKAQYSEANASLDAVSALAQGRVQVAELKKEPLPEELRGKSDKEIEATLLAKNAKRAELQKRLERLGAQRQEFLTREAKGPDESDTLDKALLNAVRTQATSLGYTFESK
jgi:hypothetical protein